MVQEQQRRAGRKIVSIDCHIDGVSRRSALRIPDIGVGGGFIDSPAPVQAGDVITLTFSLDGLEYQYRARVVHVQRTIGFGFAFLHDQLTEEARQALEQFVGRGQGSA
jgi:hypothetical protein